MFLPKNQPRLGWQHQKTADSHICEGGGEIEGRKIELVRKQFHMCACEFSDFLEGRNFPKIFQRNEI